MEIKSVGFIGGGRITQILIEGMKRAKSLNVPVVVSDTNQTALDALKTRFPNITLHLNDNAAPAKCDLVFLALHPPAIGGVLPQISSFLKPQAIFVSLAPKITIAALAQGLNGYSRIARVIPNAPSIIGRGFNPITFSETLSESDRQSLHAILSPLGDFPETPENLLEAYAIVTAMGPTYFWFQWSELKALAIEFGLSELEANIGICKMLGGAVETMFSSGLTEAQMLDLIPLKPIGEDEPAIRGILKSKLTALFNKLKN
jgi:pyrroline-5-carboxylate reductase